MMELAEKILQGDEGSAARLISMIEEGNEEGYEAISALFPYTGKAYVIGITGAPGAGKSTLVDRLAVGYGRRGEKVGIIAVDPTSAKSNGAFLGDRVRMRDAEKVDGIFIRSMAHRGFPGGVAKATLGAAYILDSMGKGIILIESVGAGQTERQISMMCHTVVTVLTPDYGDEIQLMKAGLIEIGDIVVLNKMDRPGAAEAADDIEFHLRQGSERYSHTPVLRLEARKGAGVENLMAALDLHRQSNKRKNVGQLVLHLLKEEVWSVILNKLETEGAFKKIVDDVQAGQIDPYKAVKLAMRLALSTK